MTRHRSALTPLQVLERQHGFLLKWEHEPEFRRYIAGCYGPSMAWSLAESEDASKRERYVRATVLSFKHAEAYRVTAEMTDLLLFAADRLDDSDKVDHTLAPTPFGFVAFEEPLPMIDARGEQMLVHYLTWGPIESHDVSPITGKVRPVPGVWITMWNDGMLKPDAAFKRIAAGAKVSTTEVLRLMGRYAFVGTEAMVDRDPVGAPEVMVSDEARARMAKEDAEMAEMGVEIPPPIQSGHTNPARYVHALWLLLGQTITDVRDDVMPRAAQKRAGQMPIPGKVTVISLRRRAGRKSEGESRVEWRHRWICRGHWRWITPKDGRDPYRIWIAAYAKNAHREDLPWVQSQKIYSLDR